MEPPRPRKRPVPCEKKLVCINARTWQHGGGTYDSSCNSYQTDMPLAQPPLQVSGFVGGNEVPIINSVGVGESRHALFLCRRDNTVMFRRKRRRSVGHDHAGRRVSTRDNST
jgi:hypothetical protein